MPPPWPIFGLNCGAGPIRSSGSLSKNIRNPPTRRKPCCCRRRRNSSRTNFTSAIAKLTNPDNLAKAGTLADQYVYWTGEAQFQNADLTNAAETFVSLAQNYPNSPLRLRAVVEAAAAYTQLTNWLRHDALLEDTNGVFQRAAQLDPGNALVADGWLSLENSKYQQRDFPGVVAVHDSLTNQWQTLNQGQQCQAAYLYYLAKMELGDFAAALAAATNLVQIAGAPANQDWLATARASQGEALERLSRMNDAIAAYGENLTTNAPVTQRREAILKIAELEFVQGQLTNAEESLTDFLAQFPESISADIALLTAGELHLKEYAAQPAETNHLQAASVAFNRFLDAFTNSPLAGKAYLDRGWCEWLADDTTNSLADFQKAANLLPPSEDLAVARFKMGDAMFALTNYAGALGNYRAVLDDFTNFPAVAAALGDRALYQSLRADLQLTNYDGASNALAQILERFPASNLAPNAVLLYGEGQVAATNEPAARAVFRQFLAQFPGSQLRPEVEFAIARTYELDQNWSDAIAGYKGWLDHFPTNQDRARTIFALARVNSQAGNESVAFGLFTNLVTEFPASDLAPSSPGRELAAPVARLSCSQPVRLHLEWPGEPNRGRNNWRAGALGCGHGVHGGSFRNSATAGGSFWRNLSASKHLGLAEHAPRLAVSFAILGLALVGLPGTLGFCSQDLLIHGTLTTHPLTGLLLPIATAMNAVSFFRLFSRLFLGRRRTGFTIMADALPRERWILAGIVLFLVLGGLFPNATVIEHSSEVDVVDEAIRPSTTLTGPRATRTTIRPCNPRTLDLSTTSIPAPEVEHAEYGPNGVHR